MSAHEQGELLLHTVRVNVTAKMRFYDEREPIAWTAFENVEPDKLAGALYRLGVREYGRCVGKMYQDKRIPTNDRGGERWEVIHVGYVFIKREHYEGSSSDPETYLCETWLSLERVVEPARPNVMASVAL